MCVFVFTCILEAHLCLSSLVSTLNEVTRTSYGPSILMLVFFFFFPWPFPFHLRSSSNLAEMTSTSLALQPEIYSQTLSRPSLSPTHLYSRYTCVVVDDDYDVICLSLFQLGKEHVSIICIQTKEVTKPMYLFMGRYLLYRNKPMFQ